MSVIRPATALFLFFSLCYTQGRMNGFGIGHYSSYQGIGNAVDGMTELTPAFQKEVSLSNPSTWHNLKFAYLSMSYSGNENILNESSVMNGYSSLSNAIWVVPIKSNSSIGLSLSPYSDQRVSLIDQDTSYFQAFDSTYGFVRAFDRSGGILSFRISTSYKLSEKVSLGYNHSILFGSSRQNEAIFFGGSSIIQSSRARYSGILNDLYVSLSLFEGLKLFSKFTFSLKPLETAILRKYLFDDTNGNGYHDFSPPYYDFPFPDSVNTLPEKRVSKIHDPKGFKLGINKSVSDRSSLAIEIGALNDDAQNESSILVMPFSNWIKSTNSFKASLSTFPEDYSLKTLDKFSFKAGMSYLKHMLYYDNEEIVELGFSVGLGFKFKPVGNQVDLSYYFGNREYSGFEEKEFIQQIQIGISLADIWFVKRRQK